MTSVYRESPIINVPNPFSLGGNPTRIEITTATIVDLTVTGSFNGGAPPVGPIVTTTGNQFLLNKTLADNSTRIVNFADNTIGIEFSANGTPGTVATISLNQTANRTYTIPDSGANCEFVMGAGAQTIGGAKTFNDTVGFDDVATFNSDAIFNGTATFNGTFALNSALAISGALTVDGAATLNNTLTVDGAVTLNDALTMTGAGITINGQLNFIEVNVPGGGSYTFAVADRADAATIEFPAAQYLAALDVPQTFTAEQTFPAASIGGRYDVRPLTDTQTLDATPTAALTLATAMNRIYLVTAQVVASNAGNAAVFQLSIMVKNIGGTVVASPPFNDYSAVDAPLTGTAVGLGVSGNNITVTVTGLAATTINWRGVITYAHGSA